MNLENENHYDEGYCLMCNRNTKQIMKRTIGRVNMQWMLCLCMIVGVFGLLALCHEDFKDIEIVCVNCQTVKASIPVACC